MCGRCCVGGGGIGLSKGYDRATVHCWVAVDRLVAFAATILQAFDIEDMDASSAIIDEARFLQFAGYQGHAAALHAEHLGKGFLR